jgi:hypothetical protein
MNKSNWQELDFKVASDYTYGSPEYYRTLLRQMIGLPELLPGEKDAPETKFNQQGNFTKFSPKRKM